MARRVFVHIGTPKTGTTYLQSLIWANKERLAELGLLLPLGSVREHFHLSNIARDAKRPIAAMPPSGHTAWPRLRRELAEWDGDGLVSHELFAATPPSRIPWVLNELAADGAEVHVMVTGRDLARQVPAEWQQSVKHGRTHSFRQYCETLQAEDPDRSDGDPKPAKTLFWRVQHLPRLLEAWGETLQPDRVHLITVPDPRAPRGRLWERFAGVVGVDDAAVDQSVTLPNESLGIDEIETLRRVNMLIPPTLEPPRVQVLVKQILAEGVLSERADMRRPAPSDQLHAWMVARGIQMVDQLRGLPYDVVGDLDELVPDPEPVPGPDPDDVPEHAVAQVAVEAIAALLFGEDNLPTQRLIAEQRKLAAELARRTERVRALRDALAAERSVLHHERSHPFRTYVRRRADGLRRWMSRPNDEPKDGKS